MIENRARLEKQIFLGRKAIRRSSRAKTARPPASGPLPPADDGIAAIAPVEESEDNQPVSVDSEPSSTGEGPSITRRRRGQNSFGLPKSEEPSTLRPTPRRARSSLTNIHGLSAMSTPDSPRTPRSNVSFASLSKRSSHDLGWSSDSSMESEELPFPGEGRRNSSSIIPSFGDSGYAGSSPDEE